jgi:hypothetical protein
MQEPRSRIEDNDVFTGREVKRLMLELSKGEAIPDRWIELEEALRILSAGRPTPVKPGTLRKRCLSWARQSDPLVRVTKKGEGRSSHWMLSESDICKLARKQVHVIAAERETRPGTWNPADDSEDALLSHWCDIATRNL